MKKVIFVNDFISAAAPSANNAFSLFDPVTNAYLVAGITTNITTFDELVLEYERDGEHIAIPFWPSNMTYSQTENFTVTNAQTVSIDLTTAISGASPAIAAGDTFTLEIIHKGHPNDNRCRKYASVVYGATYNGTTVNSEANLATALAYVANLISMPYIDFAVTAPGNDVVLFTVQAGYLAEELDVNGLDCLDVLTDGTTASLKITYAHSSITWTGAQMQALEASTDSMLGDHGYNYNQTYFFSLATGYLGTTAVPTCNSLVIIKSTKPDDDTLVLEPNVPQEIYIFYDHDASAYSGVTMAEIMEWVVGATDTLDAS